jgi:hypothetical protein
MHRVIGGVFSLKTSLAVVAGPTAAALVVAVGPASTAGMVALAMPGAVVEVAVIDAATKTAAPPPASPAAAEVAAAVAGLGSYSTPRLHHLLALGDRLPQVGPIAAMEPLRPGLLVVPAAPRGAASRTLSCLRIRMERSSSSLRIGMACASSSLLIGMERSSSSL